MNYEDLVIVNALGFLDNPNAEHSAAVAGQLVQTSEQLTIDERMLRDVHASGLTAVNLTLGYTMGEFEPYEHTLHEIAVWDAIIAEHPADLVKVLRPADIGKAKADGRLGIIYGFQNSLAIGEDLGRVAEFAALGVRVVQLTYNPANLVGDGSLAPGNRGLTDLGREVVSALNDANIMVDLSHSGERTCLEAVRLSRQPASINHTGCRALSDLTRNKTDEELRLVAERGGFVGIYFMPFLDPAGQATAEDVVAHLEHAIDVCGEDHVGIGTDGTVTTVDDLEAHRVKVAEQVAQRRAAGVGAAGERADMLPFLVDLRGVDQFFELIRHLEGRGHSSSRIEKILGRNFVDYAERVWAE